ncbi:hypothetical protein HX773_24735 [Pantoea sp. B9002]|uniref:hypothetical protein n=1 Tax=Pantoea sp. B9002 TaxID=2726979 RepID=UPI0015A380EF|nr:hypothetical protein [Pantoea sp. B9002]NWA64108.1 hypothetical protein [Pantoea sp. B9002]
MGIEDKIENIESEMTRSYFSEVYSSYLNGNYRAAVVSLWSVMVCDAVYKTQKLHELTEDRWAESKLNEIKKLQDDNSKSSDWELEIFEGFYKNKKFIGIGEISNIRDIQKKRHLCAHPILSEGYTLYTPNKHSVKSMIINALDDFLTRKNYYGRDVFPIILDTLKSNSEYYSVTKNIKPLIDNYCGRITHHALYHIFKDFWKFSFKLEAEEAIKNRRLNHHACIHLYRNIKKHKELLDKVQGDLDFFENISHNTTTVTHLFSFLCRNREFYKNFSNDFKLRLKSYTEKDDADDIFDTFTIATMFLFNNEDEYFTFLKSKVIEVKRFRLGLSEINFIQEVFHDEDCENNICELTISLAEISYDFDDADQRFDVLLHDDLFKKFSLKQMNRIYQIFENNSQVRNRRRSAEDKRKISKRIADLAG